MRIAHRMLLTGMVMVLAGAAFVASPSAASEPASQQATVPTSPGDTVKREWSGTIPPGANTGGDCADPADHHEITLHVPAGTYGDVRVQATISVNYSGPNDVKFTVVRPDDKTVTADSGFLDADESIGLSNPPAGTYDVVACMFAGAAPQAYTATLELEASEKTAAPTGPACGAPTQTPKFKEHLIDDSRAGGEPIVRTLDNGRLLWGSHAGTTHFYTPAAPDPGTVAFLQNYQGQTYQYFSEDNGETWEFVPRLPTPEPGAGTVAGLPATGFSDPEFAVDAAGQVYISEINLANIAVSKSTDGGRSYSLSNAFAFTSSDRQWMAADAKDVLYMTANGFGGGSFPSSPLGNLGHFMAKSTDGGVTWSEAILSNPAGVADIQIDPRDGTLYEISAGTNGDLGMAAFRKIRGETENFSDPEITPIAEGVGYSGVGRLIDPTFDMDDEGNLYIVWTENGQGARPAGIWYSYSTDRNKSWAPPLRIDPGKDTDIWPWLAVGDTGHVAVTYLAVDRFLPGNNAENATADDGWNVIVAQTANGLGCGESEQPGFTLTTASKQPVHTGTICMGGTVCQAELVDRRLGDYFANEIDGNGNTYISVSNTTVEEAGGAVALPFIIRQVSGPKFIDEPEPDPTDPPVDPGVGTGADDDDRGPSLPATGGGAVALGLLLVGAGLALRRRTRTRT